MFRVQADIGNGFVAVADLIGVDPKELLETILGKYVGTVRAEISEHASRHPEFAVKYPFVR